MLKKQLPGQLEQVHQRLLEPDHFVLSPERAKFCRDIDVASVEEAVLTIRREQSPNTSIGS